MTVLSRRGFLALTSPAATSANDAVAKALRAPLTVNEVPMRMTTWTYKEPGGSRVKVMLTAEIERNADQPLDYWVTGYGTGGTLKGVARVLAKESPNTRIVVCEPADAALLTSGEAQPRNPDGTPAEGHAAWKPHPMQGWTPDFIPKLTGEAVTENKIHKVLTIAGPDAMKCSQDLAQQEVLTSGKA